MCQNDETVRWTMFTSSTVFWNIQSSGSTVIRPNASKIRRTKASKQTASINFSFFCFSRYRVILYCPPCPSSPPNVDHHIIRLMELHMTEVTARSVVLHQMSPNAKSPQIIHDVNRKENTWADICNDRFCHHCVNEWMDRWATNVLILPQDTAAAAGSRNGEVFD